MPVPRLYLRVGFLGVAADGGASSMTAILVDALEIYCDIAVATSFCALLCFPGIRHMLGRPDKPVRTWCAALVIVLLVGIMWPSFFRHCMRQVFR